MKEVRKRYEEVGLPRHEGKAVFGGEKACFWGLQADGKAGTFRPNLKRCIPLCFIAAEVIRIGRATVGLLEALTGAFVSVFQSRRRFMSILEELYSAQRGRERSDITAFSGPAIDELFSCIALTVLTSFSARLKPATKVVASDASSSKEAAVFAEVPAALTLEMQRHCLQKGLWNRLLQPAGAYLRERAALGEEDELPDGKSCDMHPLWEEIVCTQQFKAFGPLGGPQRGGT